MLQLYGNTRSRAMRCLWMLEEVGQPYQLVETSTRANDVQSAVIPGAGHWFAEEAPEETLAALAPFLAPYRDGEGAAHDPRPGGAGD